MKGRPILGVLATAISCILIGPPRKALLPPWEMQLLLWSTLGVLFGWLTERDRSAHASPLVQPAAE